MHIPASAPPLPAEAPRLGVVAIGLLFGLAVVLIWAGWAVVTRAGATVLVKYKPLSKA